jgi:large subunit ribosomal protein L19
MSNKVKQFNKEQLKKIKTRFTPGDTLKVHQIISDFGADKEKTQAFEGVLIAHKNGKEIGATITLRGEIDGVGVERTFPLHSPTIKQIELVKRGKTRRAKLYYLREAQGKRGRLKTELAGEAIFEEQIPAEKNTPKEEKPIEQDDKNIEPEKPKKEISKEEKIEETKQEKAKEGEEEKEKEDK